MSLSGHIYVISPHIYSSEQGTPAVSMVWLQLGSLQNGQAALYFFQKHFLCTFTVSVSVDIFQMNIKHLVVRVQCCCSYQHVSSPLHQQLASNAITTAHCRQHRHDI
jgi:hypothetical protein